MFLFSETFIKSCKASTSVQTGVCTQVNPGSGGDLKDIFNCQMLNYFTSDVSYCLFFFGGGGISWESFIRRQLGNGGESIPRNLVFPGVPLSVCEPTQDPREAIFPLRSWKKQQWEKLNNGLRSLPMYSITAAASLWWHNYTPRVAGIPHTEAPCILASNWSFPNSTNKQFCFIEAERSGSQMECHLI